MAVINPASTAARRTPPALPAVTLLGSLWLAACSSTPVSQPSPDAAPAAQDTTTEPAVSYRPMPPDTLYELLVAELASHRNQYALALENYQRQAISTRDPQIAAHAARLANAVGSPAQAEQMASLWLELEPASTDAHFILAVALSRQGRSRLAFEHMQRVAEREGDASYWRIAADSLDQPRSEQEALLRAIDDALIERPEDVELLMAKSIVQQARDEEAALATARAARRLAPDNEQTIIHEAALLQQMSRHQEALNLLKDSVARAPDSVRIRRAYVQSLFAADPKAAVEQFEQLLVLTPNDPDTLFFLAQTHTRLQQYEEAKLRFRQLLQMGVLQSEAHYHLGRIAIQQDRPEQALQHFEQVEPGPEYLSAMTQIARILIIEQRLDDLHRRFALQRDSHPDLGVSLYILESDILFQLNDYDASQALLDEALEQHRDDTQLLYARALTAEKRQNLPAAEVDLRRILQLEPDNATTLNALGYLLSNHSQRYDEAHALIEQALALKPDDPTILDSMGWINYRRGQLEVALRYLKDAYSRYPDAEIGAHLGEVLWQLDRHQHAIDIWRDALQRDPDHPALRETLLRFQVDPAIESTEP